MQQAKKIAANTFYYLIFILYFLPLIVNYCFDFGLPSGFDGGFNGILLAGTIAIAVYIFRNPQDT